MQGPLERELAQTRMCLNWYKLFDKDENEVGEKGIAHLSKAEWNSKFLNFSYKVFTKMKLFLEIVAVSG